MADASRLADEIREGWRPPPRLHLDEWADEHAVMSAESSADPGQWTTLPYQRGIMRAVTDPLTYKVSVRKSARVGWTKILNHTIGYFAHHDPCPVMLVQPTIGDAEDYSKDEIAPMIRDTPVLTMLFPPPGKNGSTILKKPFHGGGLLLVGADTPRGFRRVSMRVILFDEVDGYAISAGAEGDQLKLAIMRALYFWNRKILAGSTPTLEATSRINKLFHEGDQRYFHVPCPHCDHAHPLEWENLKWENNDPETAHFVCPKCREAIGYEHQRTMIEEADRRQLAGEEGIGWVAHHPEGEPGHASFHIWAAYSYAPNSTWADIVREWLACHRNTEERKTFVNTVLGETWKGEGEAPDWKRLYDRREHYRTGIVPLGGILFLCGVDVQKDRLEVELVAYGRGRQSWSVDYRVIPGDTSQLDGEKSPYRQLDALLGEWFPHEGGGQVQVHSLGIDTGFNTSTVYQWALRHKHRNVFAMDGRSDSYKMIVGAPSKIEVRASGKRRVGSLQLWPVGGGKLKEELYSYLRLERPTEESGEPYPSGYCHFPEYPEEFFRGLTAEEVVRRLVKGQPRYHWEKVYDRNEPLDCRVYARATGFLAGMDRWDEERWTELETDLGLLVKAAGKTTGAGSGIIPRPAVVKRPDPYGG